MGLFEYNDWNFDMKTMMPEYEAGDIKILYRDNIKVFYAKVNEAKEDGYNEYESGKF